MGIPTQTPGRRVFQKIHTACLPIGYYIHVYKYYIHYVVLLPSLAVARSSRIVHDVGPAPVSSSADDAA